MSDDVEIVAYDPRWPQQFALEAARIRAVLAEPSLEVEHHGSTAVPGLAAKPVIDMLVAVASSSSTRTGCRASGACTRRGTTRRCYGKPFATIEKEWRASLSR